MIRDALGIESDELLPDDLAQRPRAPRPLHRRICSIGSPGRIWLKTEARYLAS
jgi:hypothetical protein